MAQAGISFTNGNWTVTDDKGNVFTYGKDSDAANKKNNELITGVKTLESENDKRVRVACEKYGNSL